MLLAVGSGLLLAAQRTRRNDQRPLDEQQRAVGDPLWQLPFGGRVLSAIGMLVGAAGAVLLTH